MQGNNDSDLKWSSYDFTKIPFDRIVKVGQRSMLYRDIFTVSYLLGRFCNYKCSYCWPYARSDTKDFRPTKVVIAMIDEIKRQARERNFNSFHFSFSGGEPTLHPGYLEILEHYAADTTACNYQSVHMTTNLSQGLRWWEKYIAATANLNRVSITASWHREQGMKNMERHISQFAEKLVFLQERDVQVTVNMVMVPDLFEVLWQEALYFHNQGINVTLKPQSDSTASRIVDGYSPEMLERLHNGMPQRDYTGVKARRSGFAARPQPTQSMIDMAIQRGDDASVPAVMQVELEDDQGKRWYMDQAERFNAFDFNSFEGWTCESGYRSIVIREPDGAVKRSYSCWDKPLGYIETGFKLFDEPRECITKKCISSADSKIVKHKMSADTKILNSGCEENIHVECPPRPSFKKPV